MESKKLPRASAKSALLGQRIASLPSGSSLIPELWGVQRVILAKRDKPEWKIKGIRALMWADFPKKLYAQRVQIESVFAAIKRKLSSA